MAITRRIGFGKKIVVGDKNLTNAPVIAPSGAGMTISSQSGWRMPALTPQEDELWAATPTVELLELNMLQPGHIRDTLHAYQMAKRCNVKWVMSEVV